MYFTYIIYSKNFNRYYVGLSADVSQRLKSHNAGKVKSTKAFTSWKLVHVEKFDTRIEARKREKYLKSAAGRKWRKNNLNLL
ncbi:MAG: GIY-YIG nuclease family protein [Flavobacteriaceae bacterium]|nr:GIY-YIG nuclease family protein [Flavobacteriaceae bacterium]